MTSFKRNSPPKVYHGHPAVGGTLAGPQRSPRSPVEYRVSYINNLYADVHVVWRSGFGFTIPASDERFGGLLIIRVEISLAPDVRVDVERLMSQLAEDCNAELKVMKEAIEVKSSKSRHGGTMLTLDYPVTIEELNKYGGAVYYSEIDQVVSILPTTQTPAHPYSDLGRQQYVHETSGFIPRGGLNYNLEIIDNTQLLGTRYVNIHGSIFPIEPAVAYARRDGVYMRCGSELQADGSSKDVVKRLAYSKGMEELGIFRTYEEALALGDLSHKRKLLEAQAELKLTQAKHATALEKQRWDTEKIHREQEAKDQEEARGRRELETTRKREAELHELERDRIQLKDHFESKSYVRKDSSEVIKQLPAMIMGFGAIGMAIKAFL